MKPKEKSKRWLNNIYINRLILVVLLLGTSLTSWSQSLQDQVEISKSSTDGGGGESTAGPYVLTGTIGQHDASVITSSSDTFLLSGGFWDNANTSENDDLIFEDGFETQ